MPEPGPQQPTKLNLGAMIAESQLKHKPVAELFPREFIVVTGTGEPSTLRVKENEVLMIDGADVKEFTINPANERAEAGVESAVLVGRRKIRLPGKPEYSALKYDKGEPVPKSLADAIEFTDKTGKVSRVPMDKFEVIQPGEEPSAGETPQVGRDSTMEEGMEPEPEAELKKIAKKDKKVKPAEAEPPKPPEPAAEAAEEKEEPSGGEPAALTELEKRSKEKPKSVSLIALDVDQMIQEQAARDMQKVTGEGGNWFQRMRRGVWKGNIAKELLEEHAYQFRKKQVETAHTMLSDETLTAIEKRANKKYEDAMNKKGWLDRTLTNLKDKFARNLGLYTTRENYIIAETGEMYAANELSDITEYENRINAIRARFEGDFLDADGVIRHNLGEDIKILTSEKREHKAMVKGIKEMIHKYVDGTYKDKRELESAMSQFAKDHQLTSGSEDFRQSQLYASSLYRLAEDAKVRVESGVRMNVIDRELDKMEIRIGRAQMGEATQFERSTTRRTVEWLMKKNIVGTLIANEATAGSLTAAALSLVILPWMAVSGVARYAGGILGGGSVAGVVAGLKENARLKREFFTYMRERESGGGLPKAGDKLRAWMQKREIPQADVGDLVARMSGTAYKDGKFRADMSDEDLSRTLAFLADAKARRSLSARGDTQNVSLIRWGPAVDVARTNLDLSIDKLERDLLQTFGAKARAQFGNQTVQQYVTSLTDVQSRILAEGRNSVSSPLLDALGAVSDHDPAVTKFRNRYLIGPEFNQGTAQGLDAALADVKTQIALEATRRGLKAGAMGVVIGTALSEGVHIAGQVIHPFESGLIREVHNIPPTTLPTHGAEVYGLPHYTDLQGVDHVVQAQIPDHTTLVLTDPAQHTYALADANGKELLHGIQMSDSGEIVNADALNASHDAIAHGLHFGNLTHTETLPGTPGSVTGGGYDVSAGEMAGGKGEWDWMINNMNDAHVQAVEPATNVTAKLFHYYENNVVHNQNLEVVQIPDYHREIPLMNDGSGNQIINYNAMPDNLWFRNLPEIFRPANQAIVGQHMDQAMDLYHKVMGGAPTHGPNVPGWREVFEKMDTSGDPNAHLDALLYKVGVADQNLTDAEYTQLMQLLGTPGTAPAELITHTGIIEQTLPGEIGASGFLDLGAVPAVAPLTRQGMMQGKTAKVTTPVVPPTIEPEPKKPKPETPGGKKAKEKRHGIAEEEGEEIPSRVRIPEEPRVAEEAGEEEKVKKPEEEAGTAEEHPESEITGRTETLEEPELHIDSDLENEIARFEGTIGTGTPGRTTHTPTPTTPPAPKVKKRE